MKRTIEHITEREKLSDDIKIFSKELEQMKEKMLRDYSKVIFE